jgi:hypothetical protein
MNIRTFVGLGLGIGLIVSGCAPSPGAGPETLPPAQAAGPTPLVPAAYPVQAAQAPAPTTSAAVGGMPLPPAPMGAGRTVPVPVTTFNVYHPHWTVDVQ